MEQKRYSIKKVYEKTKLRIRGNYAHLFLLLVYDQTLFSIATGFLPCLEIPLLQRLHLFRDKEFYAAKKILNRKSDSTKKCVK